MIDMGVINGERVWYTDGRSFIELMQTGEVVAIPDAEYGIVYKRTERATPLELAAQLTVEEAQQITAEWNAKLDE